MPYNDVKGHGFRGADLVVSCVPDSTFETELDALDSAGTRIQGKLVDWTGSNNYEVTSPADGGDVGGIIVTATKTTSSWRLGVRPLRLENTKGDVFTPTKIQTFDYASAPSLADAVVVNGSSYNQVKTDNTNGWGYVISVDTTAETVDVAH
jgi:hypothetical protein